MRNKGVYVIDFIGGNYEFGKSNDLKKLRLACHKSRAVAQVHTLACISPLSVLKACFYSSRETLLVSIWANRFRNRLGVVNTRHRGGYEKEQIVTFIPEVARLKEDLKMERALNNILKSSIDK